MWFSRVKQFNRHFYEIYPYITAAKVLNLIWNLSEKRFKRAHLNTYPVVLKIDPSPFCQLNCPLCHHHEPTYNKSFESKDNLSLEKLGKIIDPIKKYLFWISLSHRGEPFMNPEIFQLIRYIHGKNIAVSFPTNFSIKLDDNQVEELVSSGLDRLFISLDGASAETNGKYRVGSDFKLILSNVKRLSQYRIEQRLSKPKMVWKFIVFKHNEHEIPIVKETYKRLGFDSYEFVYNRSGIAAKRKRRSASRKRAHTNCYWPWHTMVIRSDGQVNPCCNGKNYGIGNVFNSNIKDVWNNSVYQKLRNTFKEEYFIKDLHEYCEECYDEKKMNLP